MLADKIGRTVFRHLAPASVHYLTPVRWNKARGLVQTTYQQLERDFALVPPITIHSPLPEVLAGVWSITRESLLAGPVDRGEREAVASTVSQVNQCPFCVDVHTMMLQAASHHQDAQRLIDGDLDQSHDERCESKIGQLIRWSGATSSPGNRALAAVPFARQDLEYFYGTALTFHYLNRMVNVFLDKSPFPKMPAPIKSRFARLGASLVGKRMLAMHIEPGDSLSLLDDAPLPGELSVLAGNPHVAGAFARMSAAVEQAARGRVSEDVRQVVHSQLDQWTGQDPGIGANWVDDAVAQLPDSETATGRLAVLTALASYRVSAATIEAFRNDHSTDADLIAVTAWASFAAVKRLATWLPSDPNDNLAS